MGAIPGKARDGRAGCDKRAIVGSCIMFDATMSVFGMSELSLSHIVYRVAVPAVCKL